MNSEARRYHVLEAIGKGGFGTVYKAELLGPGGFAKLVALKVLNPKMAEEEGIAERLRDEAKMLGLLHHRAIVQVDGLLMLNGRWTVVMEYVEGVDLKKLLGAGPVPVGVAVEIIQEISGALQVAYERPAGGTEPLRLLHRDIKPSNIQLTPAGEVKVLDFGVARADFKAREAETRSLYFGSVGYMSPERLDNIDSHQGDVYSLGVVLYELICGQSLGKTFGNRERHDALVDEALKKMWQRAQDEELFHLVADCLAYDAESRPAARDLERRARAVRQRLGEPWLKDWSEQVIPPMLVRRDRVADDLDGSILVEDVRISGSVPDPQTSGRRSGSSKSRTRTTMAATGMFLGALLFGAIVVIVGGGGIALWAIGTDEDSAPADGTASEGAPADPTAVLTEPDPAPVTPAKTGSQGTKPVATTSSGPRPAGSGAESAPASSPSSSAPSGQAPASGAASSSQAPTEPAASPPEASAESDGTVVVRGDASEVWLEKGGRKLRAGRVPAGSYKVQAIFPGSPSPVEAGTVQVPDSGVVTITCRNSFKLCVVQ